MGDFRAFLSKPARHKVTAFGGCALSFKAFLIMAQHRGAEES
jgi:hypothetical protein